jgi:hypothetical protein
MCWSGFLFSWLWTALHSGGWTSLMAGAHTPDVRQLRVPDHPQMAHRKAVSTALAMGTATSQADQSSGMFQGTVHNAVVMTGETVPSGQGALGQVPATLLPNTVAFGSLTAAEDVLQTLQDREYQP